MFCLIDCLREPLERAYDDRRACARVRAWQIARVRVYALDATSYIDLYSPMGAMQTQLYKRLCCERARERVFGTGCRRNHPVLEQARQSLNCLGRSRLRRRCAVIQERNQKIEGRWLRRWQTGCPPIRVRGPAAVAAYDICECPYKFN